MRTAQATFVALLGTVILSSAASQAATVTTGNISVTLGQAAQEPKIFLDATIGTTVTGHVGSQNGDPGTPVITFTSPIAVDAKNGFSSIDAVGGGNDVFHSLTVSVPTGFLFKDLVFDTLKAEDITVTGFFNAAIVGTYSNTALPNGLTEFLALATNGASFTSLVLFSNSGFSQIKQFEISGLTALTAVPLPGALVLFGSALVGLGVIGRRRKKGLAA
jgi:hypothetical protein